MPAARACQLVLAACDRHRLKRLERSQTAPYRQVLRAKIVLLAARPLPNAQIAARLGITVDTARKWRGRFAAHGLAGLADRPRPGRPPRFTPHLQPRAAQRPRRRVVTDPTDNPAVLYTRHHDGFVRQRHVQQAIGSPHAWLVPIVVKLVGEYVIEIILAIRDALSDLDAPGSTQRAVYGASSRRARPSWSSPANTWRATGTATTAAATPPGPTPRVLGSCPPSRRSVAASLRATVPS